MAAGVTVSSGDTSPANDEAVGTARMGERTLRRPVQSFQ